MLSAFFKSWPHSTVISAPLVTSPYLVLTLLPPSFTYKNTCGYTGPMCLKTLNLSTSPKSLLSFKVKCLLIPGIRTYTFLDAIILPSTSTLYTLGTSKLFACIISASLQSSRLSSKAVNYFYSHFKDEKSWGTDVAFLRNGGADIQTYIGSKTPSLTFKPYYLFENKNSMEIEIHECTQTLF